MGWVQIGRQDVPQPCKYFVKVWASVSILFVVAIVVLTIASITIITSIMAPTTARTILSVSIMVSIPASATINTSIPATTVVSTISGTSTLATIMASIFSTPIFATIMASAILSISIVRTSEGLFAGLLGKIILFSKDTGVTQFRVYKGLVDLWATLLRMEDLGRSTILTMEDLGRSAILV